MNIHEENEFLRDELKHTENAATLFLKLLCLSVALGSFIVVALIAWIVTT
jgi:hypothetical protein